MNDFLTAKELAEKLRANIMAIYRYIKTGKLKIYKIKIKSKQEHLFSDSKKRFRK